VLFRPSRVWSGWAFRWDFGRWSRLEPLDFAVVHACFSCRASVGEARRGHVQLADGGVERWFGFAEGPVVACIAGWAAVLEAEEGGTAAVAEFAVEVADGVAGCNGGSLCSFEAAPEKWA
jgi:hypothetical protein